MMPLRIYQFFFSFSTLLYIILNGHQQPLMSYDDLKLWNKIIARTVLDVAVPVPSQETGGGRRLPMGGLGERSPTDFRSGGV